MYQVYIRLTWTLYLDELDSEAALSSYVPISVCMCLEADRLIYQVYTRLTYLDELDSKAAPSQFVCV